MPRHKGDPRSSGANRWKGPSYKANSYISARCMQDVILDHLGRSPKFGEDLAEEVAHDYGSFESRTFLRNLRLLIEAGCVKKESEYHLGMGSMVPVYSRLRTTLPPHPRPRSQKYSGPDPLHEDPVGPWPGYLVILAVRRPDGYPPKIRPSLIRMAKMPGRGIRIPARRSAKDRRRSSAQSLGTSDQCR
jgi:hypothetical protein